MVEYKYLSWDKIWGMGLATKLNETIRLATKLNKIIRLATKLNKTIRLATKLNTTIIIRFTIGQVSEKNFQ
jgi:hypothetical protein